MDRRKLLKYTTGGAILLAGGGAAGFIWLDRKFNPKTPLDYKFPDIARSGDDGLIATPSCTEDGLTTPRQTEGPFYSPNTPQRDDLNEEGVAGATLIVHGFVTDAQCRPVAGAVIDMWNCDSEGVYDNDGFRLRGHQFTDASGGYRFRTIRPAPYKAGFAWRTPHIHVKVQGRNTSLLTTQLYFPDEPLNENDSHFDEALLLKMNSDSKEEYDLAARFDFVLA